MDGLKLLEKDHKLFRQLLAEGEETTERGVKTRTELFERLKREITIHEQMEEEVLYPALRGRPSRGTSHWKASRSTTSLTKSSSELEQTPRTDETWAAKFNVAKENLEHHMDEEESEMWKAARSEFTDDELETMGNRMLEIKQAGEQLLPRA